MNFYSALDAGIILCMCQANERRRYNVTSSLIGWAHTQNDPCRWHKGAMFCFNVIFLIRYCLITHYHHFGHIADIVQKIYNFLDTIIITFCIVLPAVPKQFV